MPSRLEALPREIINIIFSYLDFEDAENIHGVERLRRLDPDFLDHKARETHRSITVTRHELRCARSLGNGAIYPSPYHALDALQWNHKVAQYVVSLDLSDRLFSRFDSRRERRRCPTETKIVRRWACRHAFIRNILRNSPWELEKQVLFAQDFHQEATPFPYGRWWSRYQKHTTFTDALLLMAILPNLQALGIQVSSIYIRRITKFWDKVCHIAVELGVPKNQMHSPLEQLTILKLAGYCYVRPTDFNAALEFAAGLPRLRVLVFEGILGTGTPLPHPAGSFTSVERLEFHRTPMLPPPLEELFDFFPNVREAVFERCVGRPPDCGPGLRRVPQIEGAFKVGLLYIILYFDSPVIQRLEKLRVGLTSPHIESSYSLECACLNFLRFSNLRVLDVSAGVLCPLLTDAKVSPLNESLPPTLEVLRLQGVPDLPAAKKLFEGFREARALPRLKLVVLSGPKEILSHARSVCERVNTRVECVKTGEEWITFGIARPGRSE